MKNILGTLAVAVALSQCYITGAAAQTVGDGGGSGPGIPGGPTNQLPEPDTLLLIALGGIGIAVSAFRNKK